jgi:hypothetical protein
LSSGARVSLGTAAFFALLGATLVVAVLVVRARTPDLVLEVISFEPSTRTIAPGPAAGPDTVRMTFFVREPDPAATVTIVDSRERTVRVLDSQRPLEVDETVSYVWDGRTNSGELAAPGRYRLGVELPRSDREMVWPDRITLRGAPLIRDRATDREST